MSTGTETGPPTTELRGWGRTAPSAADLRSPDTRAELEGLLREAPPRGLLARGLGRSFGDAAQNAGGRVVGTTPSARIRAIDIDTMTEKMRPQ